MLAEDQMFYANGCSKNKIKSKLPILTTVWLKGYDTISVLPEWYRIKRSYSFSNSRNLYYMKTMVVGEYFLANIIHLILPNLKHKNYNYQHQVMSRLVALVHLQICQRRLIVNI